MRRIKREPGKSRPLSITAKRPWDDQGISRATWYRNVRPPKGGQAAAPILDFAGMTPKAIAERVLLGMATGEMVVTAARVGACRELLKIAKKTSGGLHTIDAETWSSVLEGSA